MRLSRFAALLAVALPFAFSTLPAQDTRKVAEPHIPISSITLNADIDAIRGVISPEDEQRLDTGRIQHAIDNCAAGKSVVLRADGRKNVGILPPCEKE